jgi:hypothetical protein
MPSSLLQEHNILVPISLAATLGLEQAVLLQTLGDCLRHRPTEWRDGFKWLKLSHAELTELLPFWTLEQLDDIARKLEAQGIVRLAGGDLPLTLQLVIALNEKSEASVSAAAERPITSHWTQGDHQRATRVDLWSPSDSLIEKIQQLHGASLEFIQQQAAEFVLFWRDRDQREVSWDGKFETRVAQLWRQQTPASPKPRTVSESGFQPRAAVKTPLAADWHPSEDAVQILQRTGVTAEFIDDAIPEFILYWRERGDTLKTWNSKFIAHIRRQWARYSSSIDLDNEPRLLPEDWQPSEDVYDILAMANIQREFATQQLPEFMLFWRESKQMLASWNSKFLQHVKYQWARQHQLGQDDHGGKNQSATGSRDGGFIDKHTDRSWRDGLKT